MKKRHVLITGGSSGIGKACVEAFVAAGDRVTFTYRSNAAAAKALAGKNCRAIRFEQGVWKSHEKLLATLDAPVDVLINNAALGSATVERYAKSRSAQDEALLQVNAVGVLWLTQAIVAKMKRGKIVFISSVGGGITQFPQFRLADGMSKAAIAFLARQLAAEHTHTDIDVFAVCPGATETAMFEASTLSKMTPKERTRFAGRLPKGRLIAPSEIADLCLHLCSERARVMHGAVIDASLGLGVHPGIITGGSR